jgi:hypothetical protein
MGLERAPTTGTNHLHACITFTTAKRFGAVKELFPRGNLRRVRFIEKARDYCQKTDPDYWESGERPRMGKRTDLDDAVGTLLESRDLTAVATEFPTTYVRYHGGFGALLRDTNEPQRSRPKVYWLFGPTGTGKTKFVVDRCGLQNVYISSNGLRWFDGYNNQQNVLFDDFRSSHIEFSYLLRLLDGYPVRVEVKGSSRQFNAKGIYITCPDHPKRMFDWDLLGEDPIQLYRRIYKILEFTKSADNTTTVCVRRRTGTSGTFGSGRIIKIPWIMEESEEPDSDTENYTEEEPLIEIDPIEEQLPFYNN